MEHEDYLFEVECKCGMRFNPFYDMKTGEGEATATNTEDPGTGGDRAIENPLADFSESRTAFQEIVDFGETMEETPKAKPKAAAAPAPALRPKTPQPSVAPAPSTFSSDSEMVITTAPAIPGYDIQSYLMPVSAWSSTEGDNPLAPGFEALWNTCAANGGNGLTSVQWNFTPDGTRVLLSGVPVRCVKVG